MPSLRAHGVSQHNIDRDTNEHVLGDINKRSAHESHSECIPFNRSRPILSCTLCSQTFTRGFSRARHMVTAHSLKWSAQNVNRIESEASVKGKGIYEYRKRTSKDHESVNIQMQASQIPYAHGIEAAYILVPSNADRLPLLPCISPFIGAFNPKIPPLIPPCLPNTVHSIQSVHVHSDGQGGKGKDGMIQQAEPIMVNDKQMPIGELPQGNKTRKISENYGSGCSDRDVVLLDSSTSACAQPQPQVQVERQYILYPLKPEHAIDAQSLVYNGMRGERANSDKHTRPERDSVDGDRNALETKFEATMC